MNILVTYKCDNGYKCGCCGLDWEESELYEVDEDLDQWLIDLMESTKSFYRADKSYGRFQIECAYIVEKEIKLPKGIKDNENNS